MKQKHFFKKLTLKKETITDLNDLEMRQLVGGSASIYQECFDPSDITGGSGLSDFTNCATLHCSYLGGC